MKIGIALGGGGAKGFALIGVLEALEEANIRCDIVTGTSIGSLVGAAYAAGKLQELKDQACKLGFLRVLTILSPTVSRRGLCSGKGVEKFLNNILGEQRIEELPVRFASLSTDIEAGVLLQRDSGDLIDAVRSSIAIPGLFTPAMAENKTLLDGGLIEPVPVEAARNLGADFIIAVDLFAHLPKRQNLRLFSLLENSVGIVQQQLTQARFTQHPPDLSLQPNTSSVSILSFHKGKELIQIGKSTMQNSLPTLLTKLNHPH